MRIKHSNPEAITWITIAFLVALTVAAGIPGYLYIVSLYDDLSPSYNFVSACRGSVETDGDIRRVDLNSSRITNDGLYHVRRLNPYHEIDLSNTRIDDEGLPKLNGIRASRLNLTNTNVTKKGIAKLRDQLGPGCTVVWDGD